MSEKLCLTKDEIKALTRTRLKARQLQFLRQNGIRHYIDGYGWPVVLRAAVGIVDPTPTVKAVPWRSNKLGTLPG
ncbi:TPA: DUF4224 domain-containing protein [Stenotrophomonas maltophilia]|uniref:DUF4224 domain-containing protein n=1 Tax=Stenotrophomonas maltophilia TaxID=40324 RepID=UPI0015DFD14A|nr:DUF4224 domain-containing protein [Stenotrophomonas maltophilia]MBA0235695.1 DUF4224 domain-containing protein [Stenotrophomonas maltophilia]MBA0269652.1 DUF4224 domain-containing protein [Stenotrophomonas maltophilia]MBN7829201.1 DUF4224 domain-containing protein [Stenotrophomonas maltophilia]MBN7832951.1 DUF4224 domain-containing protein [Stenotrophomonas maltophilia]MBN7857289.1 DUF4224 domain-containing protein [Stenotrophomonas maltophilia]